MQFRILPLVVGLVVGNACTLLACVAAFWLFWTAHWLLLATEVRSLPLVLDYREASWGADAAEDGARDADAAADVWALVPITLPSVCADVLLPEALPARSFTVDVDLALSAPPLLSSGAQRPERCKVELLTADGSVTLSASRALVLRDMHWMSKIVRFLLSRPLSWLDLTLAQSIAAPLVEAQELSASGAATTSSARVCLRPPMAVYGAELRLHFRVTGWLRLLQSHPWLLCSLLLGAVAAGVWVIVGAGVLVLLWRTAEAQKDAQRETDAADPAPLDDACSPEAPLDESESWGSVVSDELRRRRTHS